jgi:hypothetical protein
MCVIIYRQPNTTIDFEKLRSACTVNPDGMGLISIDRGKLELRKHFTGKGNSPETLQKFFEDTKDLHVYAHLRYRTKGATDKENVHPFGVLKKAKHGVDLQFMHNGTLSDYGTNSMCDSKHFVKSFLSPLSERLLKTFDAPGDLLHDPVYKAILEKYAGRSGVFLLADNLGNHQIINYNEGKEFDGWWASNEYSFNRFHREKDEGSRYYSYGYGKGFERDFPQKAEAKPVSVAAVPAVSSGTAAASEEVPFDIAKAEASKGVTVKSPANPTLSKRERFTSLAGVTSLSDLVGLSNREVADLVEEYPEHAVILILDLFKELYDRDREYDDMADAREAA